jgi:REP element-mobilizing transposase RayT
MVLAYHVIFGAYGFWLPNDPRGSWSDFVAAWELFQFGGPATTTTERRSVAGRSHNRALRKATKEHLKYPAVVFNDDQVMSIADGFRAMAEKSGYQVHACSIMPEHVHLVLGRFRYNVETMARLLKAEASHRLNADGRHPMAAWPKDDSSLPTPWAEGCWKVFLNSHADILRAIRYVENNPLKEGKPAQTWPFVVPFSPAS